MGDETKTGGTGPDDLKKSSATEGDTEGQRWKLPNATGDEPGAGPDDQHKTS